VIQKEDGQKYKFEIFHGAGFLSNQKSEKERAKTMRET
jgi:hypothetical protein